MLWLGQARPSAGQAEIQTVQTFQQSEHCSLAHKGCQLRFEILVLGTKLKPTVSDFRRWKDLNAYSTRVHSVEVTMLIEEEIESQNHLGCKKTL